jgi:hypothetical protein
MVLESRLHACLLWGRDLAGRRWMIWGTLMDHCTSTSCAHSTGGGVTAPCEVPLKMRQAIRESSTTDAIVPGARERRWPRSCSRFSEGSLLGSGLALNLGTKKARALIAYLAALPGRAHPRDSWRACYWRRGRRAGQAKPPPHPARPAPVAARDQAADPRRRPRHFA